MSLLGSSPEQAFSQDSDYSGLSPEQHSAPKRKKRQNFAGLTAQQKAVAKKANNRQAAQNLRDRKRQHEVELEQQLNNIETTNTRLAAQLAQLEEENKSLQNEARMFANAHIERFQLQDMAQRLMTAVRSDAGNGQSITAMLAAMGKALEAPLTTQPAPFNQQEEEAVDDQEDELLQALQQQQQLEQEQEFDEYPQQQESHIGEAEDQGEDELQLLSPMDGPVDLSGLPDMPEELLRELLPASSPAALALVPDLTALPDLAGASEAFSPLALPGSGPSPSSVSFGTQPSPIPALPVLSQETVRSVFRQEQQQQQHQSQHQSRVSERVRTSNSSVAAGAWPAVPPLPSGLQQLLMVLICTSLTRLSQAPAPSSSAAVAADSAWAPSTVSSPLSKRLPGSSACALPSRCSSFARCNKEYGLVCSPRSPGLLAAPCVC